MVLVLLFITAVGSAAVGVVYRVTEAPIESAKAQKKLDALALVLPEFDNSPEQEADSVNVDGETMMVYTARKGGEVVGYAVESFTNSGFNGLIKMMTGFEPDGNIRNIVVLEQGETPGLGSKISEDNNPVKVSFVGKSPADLKMSVKKDGGDIDAITASTISSRAYISAVNRAYAAFLEASGQGAEGWDSASGATSTGADSDAAATGDIVAEAYNDSATGATTSETDTKTVTTDAAYTEKENDSATGATSSDEDIEDLSKSREGRHEKGFVKGKNMSKSSRSDNQ